MKIAAFNTTVAAAGTPVQVSTSSRRVYCMMFQANPANAGTYAYIGLTGMGATTRWTHQKKTAPQPVNFGSGSIALSDIWVDADTTGDTVEVFIVSDT